MTDEIGYRMGLAGAGRALNQNAVLPGQGRHDLRLLIVGGEREMNLTRGQRLFRRLPLSCAGIVGQFQQAFDAAWE